MSGTQGILAEAFSASVKPAASSPPGNYHFKPHHAKDGKGFLNPWDRCVNPVALLFEHSCRNERFDPGTDEKLMEDT